MSPPSHATTISDLQCSAYVVPTDFPEADGTLAWDSTTLVLVEVSAGNVKGMGYTYSDRSVVGLIRHTLAPVLLQQDGWNIEALWHRMQQRIRNLGRDGLAATAISAIDCALWDLKAKLLGIPLVRLLGAARPSVAIYGSGGFTTYDYSRMAAQLSGWAQCDGCRWVKIKIGSEPEKDPARVGVARDAVGNEVGIFVDANGALDEKNAFAAAREFAKQGVEWFEEPVSSDNLPGLSALRAQIGAPLEIAAGEYGYTLDYFHRMLAARAVDVIQADLTRCGGVTGFIRVAALCDAFHMPLSAHCAPALHLHVASAVPRLRHQEWFHDHVRIEAMLFDGAPQPMHGEIKPDLSRSGCGLEFKHSDARHYLVG